MDYKFIEQLLERYWECQTTIEEEEILRNFFNQENIPASLLQYKPLFVYESQSKKQDTLDDSFDEQILNELGLNQSLRMTIFQRLTPLFKAVAVVCFFITIGAVVENSLSYDEHTSKSQSVAANQKDTITMGEYSIAYDNAIETDTVKIQRN